VATIDLYCPREVKTGGRAHILMLVRESWPFEFAICGEQMVIDLYVNDEFKDSIKVAPYIPIWGDIAEIWYTLEAPDESRLLFVKAKLRGAAGAIPGTCDGTDEDECQILVWEGGPPEANPPGYQPPWQLPMEYVLIGLATLTVVGLALYYEEKRREEFMMMLAAMR